VWVDDSIGAVLRTLHDRGQLHNTFFLFQQDHGQEGKGSLYEPGSRIAQFVYYPDWIKPGTVFDGVVSTVDILPTMLDFAGIQPGDNGYYGMDGISWKDDVVDQNPTWTGDEEDRCVYLELDYDRALVCGCHKYVKIHQPIGNTISSGTVQKANNYNYILSEGNYFNLCDADGEYLTSPNAPGILEYNGTPTTEAEQNIADDLSAAIDCYLLNTDPNLVPNYDTQCDFTPPSEEPTLAPFDCSRYNGNRADCNQYQHVCEWKKKRRLCKNI